MLNKYFLPINFQCRGMDEWYGGFVIERWNCYNGASIETMEYGGLSLLSQ